MRDHDQTPSSTEGLLGPMGMPSIAQFEREYEEFPKAEYKLEARNR
jgi:hypothetical protein